LRGMRRQAGVANEAAQGQDFDSLLDMRNVSAVCDFRKSRRRAERSDPRDGSWG